jgi:hypothetical protein
MAMEIGDQRMTRRLYRWKSLWLGVLVLGFLAWMWSKSRGNVDYVEVRSEPYTAYGATSAGCYIAFRSLDGGFAEPIGIKSASNAASPPYTGTWFPQPFKTVHNDNGLFVSSSYFVAHWLLMLLFLLPWAAFLAWRWRRMRRVAVPPLD